MLEKREKYEEKVNQILEILLNQNIKQSNTNLNGNMNSANSQVTSASSIRIDVQQVKNDKISSISPSKIETPGFKDIHAITPVEKEIKVNLKVALNTKSRTLHYPKSNITRTLVTDENVEWSVSWSDYKPVNYTSESVLLNPMADNNLLA